MEIFEPSYKTSPGERKLKVEVMMYDVNAAISESNPLI